MEISHLDSIARSYEQKWGVGRLERLVSAELADKFNAQRNILNELLTKNAPERLERAAAGMARAWQALDKAATEAGHVPLPKDIWTARHKKTGDIISIYRGDIELVDLLDAKGLAFSVDEIVSLIPAIVIKAKREFPGSQVADVKNKQTDEDLNDEIPF